MAQPISKKCNQWIEKIGASLPIKPIDKNTPEEFETRITLALTEASERAKSGQWCPFPSKLDNSIASPELLAIHPEIFRQMYADNISGTVEESLAELLYLTFVECYSYGVRFDFLDGVPYSCKTINNNEASGWIIGIIRVFDKQFNTNIPLTGWSTYITERVLALAKVWKVDIFQYLQWYIDYNNHEATPGS